MIASIPEGTKMIIRSLLWFFLLTFQSCSFAAASQGGGWGFGSDGDRMASYTRIGRHSIFRGSSSSSSNNNNNSHKLSLGEWAKTKSTTATCNIKKVVTVNNIYRNVIVEEESTRTLARSFSRKTTPEQENSFDTPSWISRRRRYPDRNHDEIDYETCWDASLSAAEAEPPSSTTDLKAITSPIVPLTISFDVQTGEEFADPEAMDLLVASGMEMASSDENDWIEWKLHGATKKLLEENGNNEMAVLEKGEVMVYIGTAKQEGHGSKLPIIKTKSILPLSAEEMADLLMDSSRVKIYNKLSVGRTDVKTLAEGTKVVCNLTKPPISKSNMVSCTLMHSRKLEDDGAGRSASPRHFVVSRAAPGLIDESLGDLSRNDILLGVNLLEDRGPNECVMTAVTHVYSPALPIMLAKKMGVSSAINFIKDIRSSCVGS